MGEYKWTPKRLVALECLVAARGNCGDAASLAKGEVSEDYLKDLMYRPRHAPFQAKFREESQAVLESIELDGESILDSIREMAEEATSETVRLKAWELLGKAGAMFKAGTPIGGTLDNKAFLADSRAEIIFGRMKRLFEVLTNLVDLPPDELKSMCELVDFALVDTRDEILDWSPGDEL